MLPHSKVVQHSAKHVPVHCVISFPSPQSSATTSYIVSSVVEYGVQDTSVIGRAAMGSKACLRGRPEIVQSASLRVKTETKSSASTGIILIVGLDLLRSLR